MARVPYLELPAGSRTTSNVARALANSSKGARQYSGIAMYLRFESPLNPRLRELAILQVGYTTRQIYEYAHHCSLALEFGCTEDDIRALAADSEGKPTNLDPLTKHVLRAARDMTTKMEVADETFAALKAAFSMEDLMDLLMAIASYNATVRMLNALKIDLEPEYQKYLEKFPLPKS
jgi:alkylhydroperoxidase family enzyme